MKLMMIIVSDEYVDKITSTLLENKFMITEIGRSGDFLQYGQAVLIVSIEEENIDDVVTVLKTCGYGSNKDAPFNNSVFIHILDSERFFKIKALQQC